MQPHPHTHPSILTSILCLSSRQRVVLGTRIFQKCRQHSTNEGETPDKDVWINKERLRWAHAFDIPMAHDSPPNFPPNTVQLMRALCCIESQDKLCAALERVFLEFWAHHSQVAQADVFAPILKEVLGPQEAEKVLADASTEGKTRLLKNTDKAFVAGAFGLPWLVCTNAKGETEGFWGVDHIGQVLRFLNLPKPDNTEGWKSVL
ncbi:hypothetical protein F5Y19DRAFT_453720 [Xylariaceae sp. FL1651]|nr:hypothetical protein F5Y19DRAFT_453720 [Xylariaceae sp. FL1651]